MITRCHQQIRDVSLPKHFDLAAHLCNPFLLQFGNLILTRSLEMVENSDDDRPFRNWSYTGSSFDPIYFQHKHLQLLL